jgi:hypothetical protein
MTPTGKSQPQALLEEIIPKDLPRDENEKYPSEPEPIGNEPNFPSLEAQQAYWREKEAREEPKPPRKWSLARRRAYNAKKAKGWVPVPPVEEEPVAMIKYCPFCRACLERFLS